MIVLSNEQCGMIRSRLSPAEPSTLASDSCVVREDAHSEVRSQWAGGAGHCLSTIGAGSDQKVPKADAPSLNQSVIGHPAIRFR